MFIALFKRYGGMLIGALLDAFEEFKKTDLLKLFKSLFLNVFKSVIKEEFCILMRRINCLWEWR